MLTFILFCAATCALLYTLMGGADYGAGILELYAPRSRKMAQRRLINHAMGPVWEANHMWIIILMVILFMGFPAALSVLMVSLHLPVVALLLGIVVRGAVFTFRHYDAEGAARSQGIFSALFALASLWSSMWLGILAASLPRGFIDLQANTFRAAYIAPWWGAFPLAVGLLTALSFATLACVYLVGETQDHALQDFFMRRARRLNGYFVACCCTAWAAATAEGNPLPAKMGHSLFFCACAACAGFAMVLLWLGPPLRRPWAARALGAAQISFLVLGWFGVQAPHLYSTRQGTVAFAEVAAPAATLHQLGGALVVGSAIILPSLAFLLYVFKRSSRTEPRNVALPHPPKVFDAKRRSTFVNK